jgi:hypothetical protein
MVSGYPTSNGLDSADFETLRKIVTVILSVPGIWTLVLREGIMCHILERLDEMANVEES